MKPKEIINNQWLASSALILSFVILASICVCVLCIFNSDCLGLLNRFVRRVWRARDSRAFKRDPEDPFRLNKEEDEEEDDDDDDEEEKEENDAEDARIRKVSIASTYHPKSNMTLTNNFQNSSSRSTSSAQSGNEMSFSQQLKRKPIFTYIKKNISLESVQLDNSSGKVYDLSNHYPQKSYPLQQPSSGSYTSTRRDNNVTEDLCDPGFDHGLGKLQFTLRYDVQLRCLTVKIVQAVDLPAMDLNGFSDPYVKIKILPEKLSKVQTSVKDRKLNPKWNEKFEFGEFPSQHLVDHKVHMTVLDFDRFTRDDPIGEVNFPLILLNEPANANKELSLWKFLKPTKQQSRAFQMGEILLELCYNPQTMTLSIRVKNTRQFNGQKQWNLYCQIKFTNFKEKKTLQKVKTSTQRRTQNPSWNETFTLRVEPSKLKDISIELAVKHKERLGAEVIGRLRLASRSSAAQTQHWSEMLSKPREFVAEWHKLKH